MINSLRKKFICINMALVTLVLLIVFGCIFYSTYRHSEAVSIEALSITLSRDAGVIPPKFEIGGNRRTRTGIGTHNTDIPSTEPQMLHKNNLKNGQNAKEEQALSLPIFSVTLNESNQITATQTEQVDVSVEIVEQAVDDALADAGESGVLHSLNLRFLKRTTPNGMRIAFADLSDEKAALASLLLSTLLIGSGSLLAFFAISLFLANWALKPAAQAWEQQRQFVADASHELKTPLTVILSNTDILLSHAEDSIASQRKWVEHTETEAKRMKQLVDNLLTLAKADASPAPTQHTPFDLSDAATGCILTFEPLAFEQGISLESEIEPDIRITGDESQLRQLLTILLDNACKYAGEQGCIRFTLGRDENGKVCMKVNNTGEPIPPEHLPHLFERFYRADASRARSQGGYGLGLAIAEQLVTAHHGKISVTSAQTEGTTFTIYLPAEN